MALPPEIDSVPCGDVLGELDTPEVSKGQVCDLCDSPCIEPQVGVAQVQINMNRQAAAAVGLRAEDLAETVDTAFNGHVVSQVLEDQRTCDVLVRHDDATRESFDTIQSAVLLSYQRHFALALCHVQGENAIVIVRRRFHYPTMIAAHRKVFTKKLPALESLYESRVIRPQHSTLPLS